MTYQARIAARLIEIETDLTSINAAIAAQGGMQAYTAGGEQTQLHPLNTLLARKGVLEQERMRLWQEQAKYNEGFQRPASARVVFC